MIGNQSGKPPPLTSLTVSIFLIGDHDDGDDSFTGIQIFGVGDQDQDDDFE